MSCKVARMLIKTILTLNTEIGMHSVFKCENKRAQLSQ